jgi:acetoin utilization protein AcuB
MFAIYDLDGVQFRDRLDGLYEVKTLQTIKRGEDDLRPQPDEKDNFSLNERPPKRSSNNQNAIDAYRKVADLHNEEIIYHVDQIMTHPVVTISINATLKDAWELFEKHNINQLPVIGNKDIIVGMIGQSDLLSAIMDNLVVVNEMLARSLHMLVRNNYTITTDPVSDIRRVAKVMADYKLNGIPVVNENDVLVGIISKSDIIRTFSHQPSLQLWS